MRRVGTAQPAQVRLKMGFFHLTPPRRRLAPFGQCVQLPMILIAMFSGGAGSFASCGKYVLYRARRNSSVIPASLYHSECVYSERWRLLDTSESRLPS